MEMALLLGQVLSTFQRAGSEGTSALSPQDSKLWPGLLVICAWPSYGLCPLPSPHLYPHLLSYSQTPLGSFEATG